MIRWNPFNYYSDGNSSFVQHYMGNATGHATIQNLEEHEILRAQFHFLTSVEITLTSLKITPESKFRKTKQPEKIIKKKHPSSESTKYKNLLVLGGGQH